METIITRYTVWKFSIEKISQHSLQKLDFICSMSRIMPVNWIAFVFFSGSFYWEVDKDQHDKEPELLFTENDQ